VPASTEQGDEAEERIMKQGNDSFRTCFTGGISVGKYTGHRRRLTRDEVAQLAYSFYESRGRQDGHHVEDWLRAEKELMGRYA
jgi:Protein of unknown function (DUF2934)